MIEQLFTIARNTFTESIRQPIFVVLILLGALLLVLNPSLSMYSLEPGGGGGDNKMLVDLSLSTIFLVSLFLAAFTATGVLSAELENRTVLTVVSKPVARPVFVVGKYLGVAGAIAIAFYTLSLIFLFTRRHGVMQAAPDEFDVPAILFGVGAALIALLIAAGGNYLYNWVFSSVFVITLAITQTVAAVFIAMIGKQWEFQSPLTDLMANNGEMLQIIVGLVLVFEAVLVLAAVAIAASTRLGQIMTLVLCVGVFLIGLISNSFSQLVNDKLNIPPGLGVFESLGAILTTEAAPLHLKLLFALAKLLYLLVPNLQFLWPADAITQGNPFTLGHIGLVSAYAALYITVVLCFAVMLFQTREVG